MPINQQNQATSPVQKYLKWKGSEGKLIYWDKDNEKEVEIVDPEFIVLDELSTIRGYSEEYEKPIYANEVRSLRTEKLFVTAGGKEIVHGVYDEIKDTIKAKGGRFAKNCYILLKTKDGWEFDAVTWIGASVGAWFDKEVNTNVNAVKITGKKEEKKGATKFFIPLFEEVSIDKDDMVYAIEQNQKLQEYLKTRHNEKVEEDKPMPQSDALWPHRDVAPEDIEDTPINLDEIPF